MTLEGHSVWAQAKQRARQREFDFAPHVWPQLRSSKKKHSMF